MTKTFTKVVSPRLANPGLPLMMALDSTEDEIFGVLNLGHWDLPFDLAQGGESFDFSQDREPVERLVEPFEIWLLVFVILSMTQKDNELHATNNFFNFARNRLHEISGQIAVRSYGFRQTVCCSSV